MLKYFKIKHNIFLLIGFGWLSPVMASIGGFVLLTGLILFEQRLIPLGLHLFIELAFLPFMLLAWVAGVSKLVMKNLKIRKQMLLIGAIIVVIVFPLITYIVFTNPELIMSFYGNQLQFEYTILGRIYIFIAVVLFTATGFWLSYKSIKSDNSETRLKGKLLMFAFVFLCIILILISWVPMLLILALTLSVFSAILFYAGFIFPDWAKKLFLKEKH